MTGLFDIPFERIKEIRAKALEYKYPLTDVLPYLLSLESDIENIKTAYTKLLEENKTLKS